MLTTDERTVDNFPGERLDKSLDLSPLSRLSGARQRWLYEGRLTCLRAPGARTSLLLLSLYISIRLSCVYSGVLFLGGVN